MIDREHVTSSFPIVEGIVEKNLEELVTFLECDHAGKSQLYDDVLSMVERILIRIALRRSNNVKMTAAAFLGISRNTLHHKMMRLKIQDGRE
jgi:DNA-binding protein Fis